MDVRQRQDQHAALHESFRWAVPAHFNIAQVCCTRWAQAADGPQHPAILVHQPGGPPQSHAFQALWQQACRLSHGLTRLGVQRGEPVALVLEQGFEAAVACLAVLQMGAIALPLSAQFGAEALQVRLVDSQARLAIAGEAAIAAVREARAHCPRLQSVLGIGAAAQRADLAWEDVLRSPDEPFDIAPTLADDPALLLYTSGTTGQPKGALLPHRALIGILPGFVCSQNWFGFDPARPGSASEAVFWSPEDWGFASGLMNGLLPTLYFGRPVVAWARPFSAGQALALMQARGVTHTLLHRAALHAMRRAFPEARHQFRLGLQAIASKGEALSEDLFAYCREQLGVEPNETYGQTEVSAVVGQCGRFWPARPGSMGRPYPGHRVAVLDEDDRECEIGETGELAVNRLDRHGYPDPVLFLGYWRHEATTHARFSGDWCRTGDLAQRDADGELWFRGRQDDQFRAGGYRIGPGEIEDCLRRHPAVADAAVVPKPDAVRGAVVKAYVVLTQEAADERGHEPFSRTEWEARLVAQLQAHVQERLAPYEYPHEIEFDEDLPRTPGGQVLRRVLRQLEEERARTLR